jgi:aminomethyltransferase
MQTMTEDGSLSPTETASQHQRLSGAVMEPFAGLEPLQDILVKNASARAYAVKAGQYIQIIDVDGKQCTDFQCFSQAKLDQGLQLPLDVTTTRTLMGHAYPMPGLHAKYFDQDMTGLIEVVQDTVGRHDAFAMACAAKYYDDLGYPGHNNCSDNFNAAPQGSTYQQMTIASQTKHHVTTPTHKHLVSYPLPSP